MTKPLKDINEKNGGADATCRKISYSTSSFCVSICKASDRECLGWEPQWY